MSTPKPEMNMPSLVETDEGDENGTKKCCALCGNPEKSTGSLIAIRADSDAAAGFCAGCLGAALGAALRAKPFRPAAVAGGGVIGLGVVTRRGLLGGGELADYAQLMREFGAPAPRLYCFDRGCGAFVAAQDAVVDASDAVVDAPDPRCPRCRRATCLHCGGVSHSGTECRLVDILAETAEKLELVDLGRRRGWHPCPFCHCLIEMTGTACGPLVQCLMCGHDLCYACGEEAKHKDAHKECGNFQLDNGDTNQG